MGDVRLSSNENDFVSKSEAFKENFTARNYTFQECYLVNKGINYKERLNLLKPKPRKNKLPFDQNNLYTQYQNQRAKTLETLTNHWHFIPRKPHLGQIFSSSTVSTLRKDA